MRNRRTVAAVVSRRWLTSQSRCSTFRAIRSRAAQGRGAPGGEDDVRLLNRHIMRSLVATFCLSLLVLTFVLSIGGIFKLMDLLSRNVPWRPIVLIFIHGIPPALAFAIPISALTGALLVFGRLAADGEISAMKACGISLWQIASRPLLLSLLLTAFCLYNNAELAPRSHLAQRHAVVRLGMESPFDLLDEGRCIQDFDGMIVWIGRRNGPRLTNVRIYDLRTQGLRREIRAQFGTVRVATNSDLLIELQNVRVNPIFDDRPGWASCSRYTVVITNPLARRQSRKKDSDLTGGELASRIRDPAAFYPGLGPDDLARQRMALIVELHKRIVLAVSCSAFVWLALPLGIRTHRRESSAEIGMSMILVGNFYLFLVAGESLAKYPALFPQLILWLPVLISVTLGAWLLKRAN